MLRRRVTFEEPPGEGEGPEEPPRKRRSVAVGGPGSRFPAQPSLDSDEDEEEEEEEEEEQQGPPVEGEPEELGEGRFDPHGHFLPRPQRERPDPCLEQIQGLEALVALATRWWPGGAGGPGRERERLQARLRGLGRGRGLASPGHAPASPGHAPASPGPWGEGHGQQEEEEEEPKEEGEGPSRSPAPLDMFAPPEEEGEGQREALPEVLWEYHWGGEGQGDGAAPPELFGPFSSAQMQEWAAQGYFQGGGGARCRRVDPPNPPGPFYDCGRVDFQLYT
ncbi:CD2 antigen cytoplasmic tail-binding protein 2 [Camarhynchus parvulus]|uniref:CD2 antigen cytoplasmic tail-binding protein 2 n=1 Tax=Geospiza parvula TaxID=87175 RepID=UPI00123828EE|nr:CD2 antigen cytoplasmic tail-binding protein 2 [Camarhynchus parvulus]